MYNYSRTQNDWGITAEFQQYHDTHTKITALVTEQRSMATAIKAAQVQLDQSQQCLLSSHAYKWYQLFCTLHKGPYMDPKSKRKFTSVTWWTIGMLMLTNIFTICIYFSHTPAGVVTTSFTLSYLLSNPLQPHPIVCASLWIITKVLTLICQQFLWPYCC